MLHLEVPCWFKFIPNWAIYSETLCMYKAWGAAKQRGSILASHPRAPSLIPSIPPKKFRGKTINVADIIQWCWLEDSRQWLENVDWTNVVRASGKPSGQKHAILTWWPPIFWRYKIFLTLPWVKTLSLQICTGYGHVMTLPPPGIDTDTLPSSEPDESSNFYYDHNDDDQDQDDQVI